MTWDIAIIGGGPGGLMTAHQLQKRCKLPFEATIYEASSRLGGKILSTQFSSVPAAYEAGAAELYDYSHVGDDPLRNLIYELGLSIRPMQGTSVIIDDQVLLDLDDACRVYGEDTAKALREFDERSRQWMSPQEFYDSDWKEGIADPLTRETLHSVLSQIPDAAARHYLRTLIHSDLGTEPHQTNAFYGLQNYLMNDPAYMRLYTIENGIEGLPRELAARISAEILLNQPVVRVERVEEELLRVYSREAGQVVSDDYDFVVAALPNNWLPAITWGGEVLADALNRHHLHYDYPAHYLRISVLFREPFWRTHLKDSYFMLDAFGGCCLYDESSRNGHGTSGVLGWLLAGEAAMTLSNLPDEELVQMMLGSLPSMLRHGRELFLEGRVHRWIGSVNGLPGGVPTLDMDSRHIPEPTEHPNLFVVGDYLFDSTLNGVFDSADYVAEWIAEEMEYDAEAEAAMTDGDSP